MGESGATALISASREVLFAAFMNAKALRTWLVPGSMTGVIREFDPRPGGGYRMSLFYPESESPGSGKSGIHEDRYSSCYLEIDPPVRIVQAIEFESDDPGFQGVMTMTVTLEEQPRGTTVSFAFADLPSGIRPEDNAAGTRSSLEKLARYVGGDVIAWL